MLTRAMSWPALVFTFCTWWGARCPHQRTSCRSLGRSLWNGPATLTHLTTHPSHSPATPTSATGWCSSQALRACSTPAPTARLVQPRCHTALPLAQTPMASAAASGGRPTCRAPASSASSGGCSAGQWRGDMPAAYRAWPPASPKRQRLSLLVSAGGHVNTLSPKLHDTANAPLPATPPAAGSSSRSCLRPSWARSPRQGPSSASPRRAPSGCEGAAPALS